MLELSKYYPTSETIHIRGDDTAALCGRTAAHGVVTNKADRFGMVNCKKCRAIYMEQLKVERNGASPTVSPEGGSLAGLLQALALTGAGHLGYRTAMRIAFDALTEGYI